MEAASAQRTLTSDKAERIVEAMRSSVARRGVAGSTFDHVAREAGVSRGLLHYYFGTKERLLAELQGVVEREPELLTLIFELFTLGQRNPDLAAEFAELVRRTRDQLAEVLAAKRDEGVVRLAAAPEAVADVLFSLADGMAMRMVAEPDRDWSEAVAAGVMAIRPLLDAR